MEINFSNYEVFVIDYLDKKLGPIETAQLLLFLEENPQIKSEIENLEIYTAPANLKESFGFIESLIRPNDAEAENLNINNYPHYFVAANEGDLSEKGMTAIKNFLLVHSELNEEYRLFSFCKLTPDKKAHFPQKEKLKIKPRSFFIRNYFATGIAAGLLLLAAVYFQMAPNNEDALSKALNSSVQQQSTNEKVTSSKVINKTKSETEVDKNKVNSEKGNTLSKPTTTESNKKSEIKPVNNIPVRKINTKPVILNTTPIIAENKTRNFYTSLYEDIKLSQELALSNEEDKEELAERETHQKKLTGVKTGRILSSVIRSGEQIADQVPESLNAWLIADIGIKGFNLLTNNSYTIDRRYDATGSIKHLAVVEK